MADIFNMKGRKADIQAMKFAVIAAAAVLTLTSCSSTPLAPFAPAGKALTAEDCLPLELPQDQFDMESIVPVVEFAAQVLIEASEKDATQCATDMGLVSRVVKRDGESFAVTMDYSPTRVNFTIESGIVTDVTVG